MFTEPMLDMRMSSGKLELELHFPLSFAIDSEFGQKKNKKRLLALLAEKQDFNSIAGDRSFYDA